MNELNLTWTIKSVDQVNSNVDVLFGCDNQVQTINLPSFHPDAVTQYLDEYTITYARGVQARTAAAEGPTPLDHLIDQQKSVDLTPAQPPVNPNPEQ